MTRIAAVDIGTNSTRLYVADGLNPVERSLVITRLGQGVDVERRFHPDAVARTLNVLHEYKKRCDELGVTQVRVAATSAVRDAADRDAFCLAVQERTGWIVDVLSGDEEAALSFAGATADLREVPAPYCVVDIGGGSTELVVGEGSVDAAISLDIGSVRLTERSVKSDPPTNGQLREVREAADEALERAERDVKPGRARTLVGVAGTITTVSAVSLGLAGYDRDAIHHSVLARAQIASVLERLVSMTSAQRRELPAMPKGREDVIVAGVVILEQVMERFGFATVMVSESDILDGLVASIA